MASDPGEPAAEVADGAKVFASAGTAREMDRDARAAILNRLTQYDQSPRTTTDADRCGPTALIGAVLLHHGQQGVIGLVKKLRGREPEEAALASIGRRAADRSLTYGDLGLLGELLYRSFEVPGREGEEAAGLPGHRMNEMFRMVGFLPPKERSPEDYEPGEAWAFLIDNDYDYEGNHWVAGGKLESGCSYFYDPLPAEGLAQLYFDDVRGYDWYLERMRSFSTGPAPRSEVECERARRRYGQS